MLEQNHLATQPIDQRLDTTGLVCPLPVLKAARLLRTMAVGQLAEIIATDEKAEQDIPVFCREQGYKITKQHKHNGKFVFVIQK